MSFNEPNPRAVSATPITANYNSLVRRALAEVAHPLPAFLHNSRFDAAPLARRKAANSTANQIALVPESTSDLTELQ